MAGQLKEQGNAFFVQKDFVRAHEKYTEAIAIDGQNAVLYANRSACSFGMGRYLDASRDARQATLIDPGYAKGWSRLATALDAALEFTNAVKAWQEALDALPKVNLTPAELKQKEQYASSLEKAKERLDAESSKPFPGIVSNLNTDKLPWQAAEEMMPELLAAGRARYSSSAYVIFFANQEYSQGVEYMKSLKKDPIAGVPDGYAIVGHTEGLACITNGLMRDQRVFRMDCGDWFDKYNDQVHFEAEKWRAWVSDGAESIKQKALERLKKEGWDQVRPALSVVVRSWIMRAMLDNHVRKAPHVAVERLKEALELLHWGRQVWRDVRKDDRGAIFQDTFVRGVKVVYLEVLISAHGKANSADKDEALQILLQEAREVIEELGKAQRPANPTEDAIDPGFVSSFYCYPAAHAYAATGYCHVQLARASENAGEKTANYLLAVNQYTQAVQLLPEDDELYCWYLHCTLDPMKRGGVSREMVDAVAKRIRAAMPKMQRIWAHSALAKQGRDATIETALRNVRGISI